MPLAESLATGGAILAFTAVTFVAVSYVELQQKIKDQITAGETPYELQTDKKPSSSKKKKPSKRN